MRLYKPPQIAKALYDLRTEAGNPNRNLYDNNKRVYSLRTQEDGICACAFA